jgi:hypothetical protein
MCHGPSSSGMQVRAAPGWQAPPIPFRPCKFIVTLLLDDSDGREASVSLEASVRKVSSSEGAAGSKESSYQRNLSLKASHDVHEYTAAISISTHRQRNSIRNFARTSGLLTAPSVSNRRTLVVD